MTNETKAPTCEEREELRRLAEAAIGKCITWQGADKLASAVLTLAREIDTLEKRLEESKRLYELTIENQLRWMRATELAEKRLEAAEDRAEQLDELIDAKNVYTATLEKQLEDQRTYCKEINEHIPNHHSLLAVSVNNLIARLEAAEQDTARLDWLTAKEMPGGNIWWGKNGWVIIGETTVHQTLREAIDAARKDSV